MKASRLLALWLLSIVLAAPRTAFAAEPGQPLPDISLTTSDGKTMRLTEHRGKIVVIDFWASWCTSCQNSLRWLKEVQREHAGEHVKVITVNLDESWQNAEDFIREGSLEELVVLKDPEGKTPAALNLQSIPGALVIDQRGIITSVHYGSRETEKQALLTQVRDLLP